MPGKPAEKPKVYDAQFNARLQRLERMIGQESGGDSGDALPSYDNSDIGKVLTVVSEYETTGEAIQSQSVELVGGIGTLDAEKVDVSNWTDGQLVSVVFNGTPYVLELSNIEGSISCGNEYFQLYYNSGTGVMNIESLDAVSPVTVSAQYVTEHANADWDEPSGSGSGIMYFYITEGEDDSLVSSKTYEELKSAIQSGIMPIAMNAIPADDFNGFALNLCDYSEFMGSGSIIFSRALPKGSLQNPNTAVMLDVMSIKITSTNEVIELNGYIPIQ